MYTTFLLVIYKKFNNFKKFLINNLIYIIYFHHLFDFNYLYITQQPT